MTDFDDYEDAELCVRLPAYLRSKKGTRFFAPDRRTQPNADVLGLAIELYFDREQAEAVRNALESAGFVDWMGVEQRLVHRGETSHVDGGFESLSTSFNTHNGDTLHTYGAVFPAGDAFVHLSFHGRGDITALEAIGHEIARSTRLKHSAARDNVASGECVPAIASQVDGSQHSAAAPAPPARFYLMAKARTRSKFLHSAIILPDEHTEGVRLFLMARLGDELLPGGSSWHESAEAAKADAASTLKIRESDWVTHEGAPEWAAAFREAAGLAIENYLQAPDRDAPP